MIVEVVPGDKKGKHDKKKNDKKKEKHRRRRHGEKAPQVKDAVSCGGTNKKCGTGGLPDEEAAASGASEDDDEDDDQVGWRVCLLSWYRGLCVSQT
jgi:hypothetical protein